MMDRIPKVIGPVTLISYFYKKYKLMRQIDKAIEDGKHCNYCDGVGSILICVDDMCHGLGKCIHGDGEEICPTCDGEGIVYFDGEEQN